MRFNGQVTQVGLVEDAVIAPVASRAVSIVIPTLNEAENVGPLVRQVMAHAPRGTEIIIVDDGSTDGTRDRVRSLAQTYPLRLVERENSTLGLSGAVIAGARAARGEILVVMDADLSHPPQDLPSLVRPVSEGRADMVIGSRYVAGGTTPGWPLFRRMLSRVAAGVAYPLTGIHDSMCGFFAIRRLLFLELTPAATGFKIAFEAIINGGRDLRVLEVPIVFRDRLRGTSKMNVTVALLFSVRWLLAATTAVLRGRSRPRPEPITANRVPVEHSKLTS